MDVKTSQAEPKHKMQEISHLFFALSSPCLPPSSTLSQVNPRWASLEWKLTLTNFFKKRSTNSPFLLTIIF